MKVIKNDCYGGYSYSRFLCDAYKAQTGCDLNERDASTEKRTDPVLIALIEKYGSEVTSGPYAELEIVEIPDDVHWFVDDYDGLETIREISRAW